MRSLEDLPSNSFKNIAKRLRAAEYKSFIENHLKIKEATINTPTYKSNPDINRESFVTVLQLISKYNLQTSYPNLYTLYKILVVLPIGLTKCERSFSKLKIIKNRLRSSMGQSRLCTLMLISVERELWQAVDPESLTHCNINTLKKTANTMNIPRLMNLLYLFCSLSLDKSKLFSSSNLKVSVISL